MPRALAIRKPTPTEIRELNKLLEEELKPRQRRRAEAILLYAIGMTAIDIARFLDAHVNTIHADLRAFDYQSLNSVRQSSLSGAPTRWGCPMGAGRWKNFASICSSIES